MENIIILDELQNRISTMESNLSSLISSKINELSLSTTNVSNQLSNIDTKYNNIYIRDFSNIYIRGVTNIANFNNVLDEEKHSMSASSTDWKYFINNIKKICTYNNYYTNICTNFISQMEGTFSIYWTTHSWGSTQQILDASYFHIVKNDNTITNIPFASTIYQDPNDQARGKYSQENLSTNVGDNWKIIFYVRPEGSNSVNTGSFSTIFNDFYMLYNYSNITQPKSIKIISSI